MTHLRGHGVRVAQPIIAAPRTDAPPLPSRGTREHGEPKPLVDDWRDRCACVPMETSLFFGDGHDALKTARSNRAAKKICADCPVEADCLAFALVNGERWGVWGRTTPKERSKILRERVETSGRARQRIDHGLTR